MHPELVKRFPLIGMLWIRSATVSQKNYFSIYDSPSLHPELEKQFTAWEELLQLLDSESLNNFLRKAAGKVTAPTDERRGWSQLVDSMNEVRGYKHATSLGYQKVRLLNEQTHPYPDIEATGTDGKCLIEVKTIHESYEALQKLGKVQTPELRIPARLTRVLQERYSHATKQIAGHPVARGARRICYLIINLDFRTALAVDNKEKLQSFIQGLQTDVEIHCDSLHWSAKVTPT